MFQEKLMVKLRSPCLSSQHWTGGREWQIVWGRKGGGVEGRQKRVLRGTSGTPPTAVETTMSPAAAASTMAMQKASVSDAFMKISPLTCIM